MFQPQPTFCFTHSPVQGDLYGEVRAKRSQLLSSSPECGLHSQSRALLRFFCSFWQFRVQTVATAMNATGSVQLTPHRTHTRALFSLRTPHVITRLAQGPDESLCVYKCHFIICHAFVECSFDPVSSCLLTVCYHADATYWNQTKVRDSALGWTVWPIRLQTQVMEHTPINLPDSNWNFSRRDDATIISRFSAFRSIQQQQTAASKVPTM